jgi:hypothetical protein
MACRTPAREIVVDRSAFRRGRSHEAPVTGRAENAVARGRGPPDACGLSRPLRQAPDRRRATWSQRTHRAESPVSPWGATRRVGCRTEVDHAPSSMRGADAHRNSFKNPVGSGPRTGSAVSAEPARLPEPRLKAHILWSQRHFRRNAHRLRWSRGEGFKEAFDHRPEVRRVGFFAGESAPSCARRRDWPGASLRSQG